MRRNHSAGLKRMSMCARRTHRCSLEPNPDLPPWKIPLWDLCAIYRLRMCRVGEGGYTIESSITRSVDERRFEAHMISFCRIRRQSVGMLCMLWPALCFAAPANFEFFQVPGAISLVPASINNALNVTGNYRSADGIVHGFLRAGSGKLTKFDVGIMVTQPIRINIGGEIAGIYSDVSGFDQGFIRLPNGVVTQFNLAGSGGSTEVTDINASGTIIGIYSATNSVPPSQAYFRSKKGIVTTFTVPGSTWVYPESINDAGEITGFYFFDGGFDGGIGGFVRTPGGVITTFDSSEGIAPLVINQGGTVAGWYASPSGAFAPFVRQPSGVIARFRVPGIFSTFSLGMNQAGFLAGSYTTRDIIGAHTPGMATHGFVRSPQGAIASFDVPGANNTLLTDINDSNVVIGYSDSTTNPGGFLLAPDLTFGESTPTVAASEAVSQENARPRPVAAALATLCTSNTARQAPTHGGRSSNWQNRRRRDG